MKLIEKLNNLMTEKGYNKRTLSAASGIPYTTIVGLFTKGYEGARMSTISRLAEFFNVTLDSFCRDEVDQVVYISKSCTRDIPQKSYTKEEIRLIENYRLAASADRMAVDAILSKYAAPNVPTAAM
ncbi:MAG: helix-turn-helix domain-containing protein [Sporomusa sp.]